MEKSFLYFVYFIASCCLVVLAPSRSAAQKLVPIKVAIYHALDNNLQVKQARFQEALSEEDLKQAKSQFYPTLNADVNGSMRFVRYFDQYTDRKSTRLNSSH